MGRRQKAPVIEYFPAKESGPRTTQTRDSHNSRLISTDEGNPPYSKRQPAYRADTPTTLDFPVQPSEPDGEEWKPVTSRTRPTSGRVQQWRENVSLDVPLSKYDNPFPQELHLRPRNHFQTLVDVGQDSGMNSFDEEFNPHLSERLEHRHHQVGSGFAFSAPSAPSRPLDHGINVHQYVNDAAVPANSPMWLSLPEIPMSEEITACYEPGTRALPVNNVLGPWQSKEEYLRVHYGLLREDAIRPLREGVEKVKNMPYAKEADYGGAIGVYENVHVIGVVLSNRGLAIRVVFSLARAGKRIHWEQSKRLISGSLVALTPASDMFRSRCVIATVGARPLSALEQDPPEIDLFFPRPEQMEIDPTETWIMVEERTGFYEAARHTLMALQRLTKESFPLSEHLVDVQPHVHPPVYLMNKPCKDLSAIVALEDFQSYENVDIIHNWPVDAPTGLDKSQSAALKRILTKRLAIVQGPPGTGKTYVSNVALKVLLSNMRPGDPPIIVTCQTNHALDQLLRHIAQYEPHFIRLGGRSKDQDIIKKRTLFEYRNMNKPPQAAGAQKNSASKQIKQLTKEMLVLLTPLQLGKGPLDHNILKQVGLLSPEQCNSLERGDTEWVQNSTDMPGTPMERWMGKSLIPVQRNIQPEAFGFEYEEADLEFEQLKELEAENFAKDDDELEALKGPMVPLADNYTGKAVNYPSEDTILVELRKPDLNKIPQKLRGSVYCYLQRKMKERLLSAFRAKAVQYERAVVRRRIGLWEENVELLKDQKVIGMTTTGFSKYRAMVTALKPKVVLIEEAAETLEAPVIAACVPSLEHLILVGDHQQLRPRCQVKEHEDEPFNLNMSLFERMVKNNVEFDSLKRQRRMIPEIRRILKPIYGDLITDHQIVKNPDIRPPVVGMGGCNSFFFTHEWPESRDNHMSCFNQREADMIVGFFDYLVYQGAPHDKITVLTFYNGQRKAILRGLRNHPNLQGHIFKVVTVDSYQGEENDVILLSLVRSNDTGNIGFLNVDNRVCVALSRAKCGMYIFGNGQLLCGESKTWTGVVEIMYGKRGSPPKTGPPVRLGFHLPIVCIKHGRKTYIQEPEDWSLINGGCEKKCRGRLPCGHGCTLRCHPYHHDAINCLQKCDRALSCGHPCAAVCSESCRCDICVRKTNKPVLKPRPRLQNREVSPIRPVSGSGSDPSAWQAYANGGVVEDDRKLEQERLSNLSAERQRRLDATNSEMLFSMGHAPPSAHHVAPNNSAADAADGARGRKRYIETFVTSDGYKLPRPAETSLLD